MTLDERVCRERFASSPVARLATVGADGIPHLVPVTCAVLPGVVDVVVVGVDHKPKTTTRLRRLRNIGENPSVAFLVDDYADDWTRLWWVRADAHATVLDGGAEWHTGIDALEAKYVQYQGNRPSGPLIRAEVTRWSGWAHS